MGEQKIHQPPMTIEEQVEKLNDISYFRLIKVYSLNLKPRNGNYYTGVTFEHIVELYLLNSNFRQLIFPEIEKVENLVNEQIKRDLPVTCEEMSYEDAKKSGAIGLFTDKYGDRVKVYTIGDFSKEICGGPHVTHTGDMGRFKIKKEESSSSGIRRIKAVLVKE